MGLTQRLGLKMFGGSAGGQISDDGYQFSNGDRRVIDTFLAALEGHTHAPAVRLADPIDVPAVTLDTTAGLLSAGLDLYYRVAFVDAYGLETAASQEVSVQTPLPIDPPSAPALSQTTGGTLADGVHYYACSFITGEGEETTPSPASTIIISALGRTTQVDLPPMPADATGIRIYRQSPNESQLYLIGSTTADFVDSGLASDPTKTPAAVNTTNSSNRVLIEAPDLDGSGYLPAGVASWRIYRAYSSGQYGDAALVHEVTEREVELDPTSPLLTTYYDAGDALREGLPRTVSSTFQPPTTVPAGSLGYDTTGTGIEGTTLQTAITEVSQAPEMETFAATGVTASATVVLLRAGVAAAFVVPAVLDGWVIAGLTAYNATIQTGGTATFRALVNQVAAGAGTLVLTMASRKGEAIFAGADRVAVVTGQELQVDVTTDAGFAPAGDFVVSLLLQRV